MVVTYLKKLKLTIFFQFWKKFVQNSHFSAIVNNVFISGVGWSGLGPVKQIGMVDTFSQLHKNILQSHFLNLASAIDNINVFHENFGVPFPMNKK